MVDIRGKNTLGWLDLFLTTNTNLSGFCQVFLATTNDLVTIYVSDYSGVYDITYCLQYMSF